MRRGQEFSTPGFAIAVLAIPVMWWLANAKIRIADQIGSRQQAYLRIARFFAGLRAKAEQLDAVQRRYRILSEAPRKYLHGRQLIPPARVVLALDRPPTARKLADDHDEVAGDTPVR